MAVITTPTCPYCGARAELVGAERIYPGRGIRGLFWRCAPCRAWVGCHTKDPDTRRHTEPLGSLAKAPLRALRSRVHAALDPLWKAKAKRDRIGWREARTKAYAWLGEQLGVPECHVGWMDERQCERALEVLRRLRR